MKDQKGITLIALVMTIVLIFILAGIGTYSGIEAYSNMQVQAFVTKMIALQEKVDVYCDKNDIGDIGGVPYSSANAEAKQVLDTVIAQGNAKTLKCWSEMADGTTSNYKYFDINAIESEIGFKDFDVGIWLNPTTRNVIAVKGVEVNKVKYYRQYDLSGGQTLLPPLTNTNTTLDVKVQTYDNKAVFTLPKQFAKVTCNLTSSASSENVVSTQIFTHTDTVTVTETGTYQIIATDYDYSNSMNKKSNVMSVTVVNKPMLVPGLTPVVVNSSNNTSLENIDLNSTAATEIEKYRNWYNYDSGTKKWANAKAKDGSVYVWIPRFAYNKSGSTINIKFMSDISNSISSDGKVLPSGYKVAPAFQNGVTTGFQNGEWDNDITGFWVAKYEAKVNSSTAQSVPATSGTFTATPINAFIYCRNIESVDTYFTFNSTNFKKASTLLMSNSTTISTADYGVFKDDSNNIDTHLMKNSEYAAVAYLTYSNYGYTSINMQGGALPGYQSSSTRAANNTTTTNNTTGVYGTRGGLSEIAASAYNVNGIFNKANVSTKYATRYYNDSASSAITPAGDGIVDVPISLTTNNKVSPTDTNRCFLRGGNNSDGQLFGYNALAATGTSGFRPVIIIEY